MLKKLALISAASTFAVGIALAQAPNQPAPSSPPAATETAPKATETAPKMDAAPKADATGSTGGAQFVSSQKPEQFLASKFKGTDVVGAENEKIGDLTDILFDKEGKIEAFVVSVGGFLGMGAKDVAMAPKSFTFEKDANTSSYKAKVTMTKDQLKQAANFEPYKEPAHTTTGAGGGTRPGGAGGGGMGGSTR
jgi:sporulation protein YlmC with PRC-barrel domain